MAEILLHRNAAHTRKQWKSTRIIHGNGLEAPRNSLDLPSYDNTMTYQVRQRPSKGSTPQERTTDKNVINKDFPSQPSVIARLMGIDTIPIPAKDAVMIHAQETSNLKLSSTMEINVTSPRSAPFRQSKCSLISYRSGSGDYRHCLKKMRPRIRARSRQRHPQEELLEKIREDFQAWQTSKALENARTVAVSGSSSNPMEGNIQMLAQESLRKEKMTKYGYVSKIEMEQRDTPKSVTDESCTESATKAASESRHEDKVIKVLRVSHCATSEKSRDLEDESNHSTSAKSRSQSQARIVILKPSSDIGANGQESLFSSSKVKREGNMEEFLEEVKERLKEELKQKAKSEVIRTSWGTDPKQIARDVAKQMRETVGMQEQELGKRLTRSESFRAFRSDRKRNARNASPEHVWLKSVTTRTETVSYQESKQGSNDSYPITSRGRIMPLTDIPLPVSGSDFDEQSCTRECKVDDAVAPRALVRSLSALASGISHQGRLFADDSVGNARHGNSLGAAVASKNSGSFSLRGTVSNLRHSFSSGANRLFGRKTHWSKKPSLGECHPQKMAIGTPPSPPETFSLLTSWMYLCQDNFTELPPSPVSPLEVKGNRSRHFFRDLDCTLPELSPKCWSESEAPSPRPSNGSSCRTNSTATETESSRPDRAYIKQVLTAAGLYDDGSANARVDSMARPIYDDIFQEVEEVYYHRDKMEANGDEEEAGFYNNTEENAMDHRMLFDLANEALEILLTSVKPGSSLGRWVVDSTGMSRGRKLVDDVWQQVGNRVVSESQARLLGNVSIDLFLLQVQALRNPLVQEMQTVDSIVAREAWRSAWIEVLYEDAYVLGRKVERTILDELISDIVQELFI
ncbi:hypothetical protein ABZP36_011802 [Zizania latifolia]